MPKISKFLLNWRNFAKSGHIEGDPTALSTKPLLWHAGVSSRKTRNNDDACFLSRAAATWWFLLLHCCCYNSNMIVVVTLFSCRAVHTARMWKPVVDVIKLFWRKSRFPLDEEIEKYGFFWCINLHKYVNTLPFWAKIYSETVYCFKMLIFLVSVGGSLDVLDSSKKVL